MGEGTTGEGWRHIAGFEGFYQVSDLGRVRSLNREIICHNGVIKRRRGVLLSPGDTGTAMVVNISRNGRGGTCRVHHLVLDAFVGLRPPGTEACHWDDDHTNNRLSNLRWGTHSDNMQDCLRNGTNSRAVRTHCPRGHALVMPNLVPSELRTRGRKCLACSRAASMTANRVRAGEVTAKQVDMQALSDLYLAEIVATGGAARVRPHWIRYNIPLPQIKTAE